MKLSEYTNNFISWVLLILRESRVKYNGQNLLYRTNCLYIRTRFTVAQKSLKCTIKYCECLLSHPVFNSEVIFAVNWPCLLFSYIDRIKKKLLIPVAERIMIYSIYFESLPPPPTPHPTPDLPTIHSNFLLKKMLLCLPWHCTYYSSLTFQEIQAFRRHSDLLGTSER